jgi:hypothetical protein
MRPRAVEAYLACTKRAGEGPRLPSSLTSRPIACKYSREGNTGVQADEWLRFRDFDPIRIRTLHSLRTVDGMASGSSAGLDSPWLQQVRSDRSPECAPRPMRSDTRVWHADAESLRKWQLECRDHDEGIVEADGATRQQASTQRPDSHDQAAETRTTGGQRSMISLRECERSPRNVARSGVGGLSISVWRALPLLKRQTPP